MEERLLSMNEVARACGLSRKTLEKMRRAGGGPRTITIGRRRLVRPTDLAVFLEACSEPPLQPRDSRRPQDTSHSQTSSEKGAK